MTVGRRQSVSGSSLGRTTIFLRCHRSGMQIYRDTLLALGATAVMATVVAVLVVREVMAVALG